MSTYQAKTGGLFIGIFFIVVDIIIFIISPTTLEFSRASFIGFMGIIANVIIIFAYWQTKWEQLPPRMWHRGFVGIPMLAGLGAICLTYLSQHGTLTVKDAVIIYGSMIIAVVNISTTRNEVAQNNINLST